jgi:steroid delta-isomerase-like uncharacterized protein
VDVRWGDGCQLYVRGVGTDEVCVAVIARRAMRLDEALAQLPEIEGRLAGREATSAERGSVTVMRRFDRVWRGNIALVGDASGSLDAISGDGLRLALAQALAVAEAFSGGDLADYGHEHARLRRVPSAMTDLLLALDRWVPARSAAMCGLNACPWIFETLMALHTGTLQPHYESGTRLSSVCSLMSEEQQVINRFIDEFQTGGNTAAADELLASDFVDHTPFPGFGSTREDVKRLFATIRVGLPDLRAEVVDQVTFADRVGTRKNFHGTHLGELFGFPPTGRYITIRVMDLVRIANGQIVEHWNVVDVPGLMAQLRR